MRQKREDVLSSFFNFFFKSDTFSFVKQSYIKGKNKKGFICMYES